MYEIFLCWEKGTHWLREEGPWEAKQQQSFILRKAHSVALQVDPDKSGFIN